MEQKDQQQREKLQCRAKISSSSRSCGAAASATATRHWEQRSDRQHCNRTPPCYYQHLVERLTVLPSSAATAACHSPTLRHTYRRRAYTMQIFCTLPLECRRRLPSPYTPLPIPPPSGRGKPTPHRGSPGGLSSGSAL